MPHSEFKEYGEALLAVANSMNENKTKTNINKANSSLNKEKLYKNTIEDTTLESMSMTFTQENLISITLKLKTRKLESNLKILLTKLRLRKLNCKSKQPGQNSMSLLRIYIILLVPKLFLEFTTHLIHN